MLAVLALVAACGGIVATTEPAAERACVNTITPAAFRIVYSPTDTDPGEDTTAVLINRYAFPYRSADTVIMGGKYGERIPLVLGKMTYDPTRCFLLSDSLYFRLPHSRRLLIDTGSVRNP